MQKNIGGVDKTIRLIIGVALLSLIFILEGNARWFGLIGLLPIITALLNWCPAYTLIGLSTCPTKSR